MIMIEKNIPIPPPKRSKTGGRPPAIGREAAETMDKMEVDDSILVPTSIHKNTLYVFLARERRRTGKRYKMREVTGGYRIWRVE
jgi:hypothetical protein